MEPALINAILKWGGAGVGSGGLIVLVVFLFLHLRVKDNKKRHDDKEPMCKQHDETLQEHTGILIKITENQKSMNESLKDQKVANKQQNDKLDMINNHLINMKK